MTYYEVWGYDTFASESYFCGRYSSQSEAQKVLNRHEVKVAKSQDAALRDTFSIATMTDEDIALRKQREREISREQSYDSSHLTECVKTLLKQFRKALSETSTDDWLLLQKEQKHLTQQVWWDNEKDCFTQVSFESYTGNDNIIFVGTGICVKSGRFVEGGQTTIFSTIRGTCYELIEWAKTKEAVQQCMKELEKLISHIYEDQR